VTGNLAPIAKFRSDELAKDGTKKTLNWLATAEAQRPTAPLGAGSPGQRPLFGVDDFSLPSGTSPAGTPVAPGTGTAVPGETGIEEFFKSLNQLPAEPGETDNRYHPEPEKENSVTPTAESPSTDSPTTTNDSPPATGDAVEPADAGK
jgi:hypothetical protein